MWRPLPERATRTACRSQPAPTTSWWKRWPRRWRTGRCGSRTRPRRCGRSRSPPGRSTRTPTLRPAPEPVTAQDLTEEALPEAWSENRTSGLSLTQALGQKRSAMVPWGVVREGIAAAVNTRWLLRTADSGPIECTYDQAHKVILEKPKLGEKPKPPPPATPATLDLTQMQDLADRAPDLLAAIGAAELRFGVHVRSRRSYGRRPQAGERDSRRSIAGTQAWGSRRRHIKELTHVLFGPPRWRKRVSLKTADKTAARSGLAGTGC